MVRVVVGMHNFFSTYVHKSSFRKNKEQDVRKVQDSPSVIYNIYDQSVYI